jgi:hypothetical protein
VQLEGLGKSKNSFTSLRLKPATFQLVAQRLNHYATARRQYATSWKAAGLRPNEVNKSQTRNLPACGILPSCGGVMIKALCYKLEGCGFETQ